MTEQISNRELAKLEAAANADDVSVQYLLGQMYENGLGIPKAPKQAIIWYKKAAGTGHALAQINLGWMYAEGHGVDKDDAEAASWWSMAAAQDNARAKSYLRAAHSPISASDLQDFVKGSMLNSIKDEVSAWALHNCKIGLSVFALAGILGFGGGGLYIANELINEARGTINDEITQKSEEINKIVVMAQDAMGIIQRMAQDAQSSLEDAQSSLEAAQRVAADSKRLFNERLEKRRQAFEAEKPVIAGERRNVE